MNFNSYVIDFEEAFDILIKDNPSWLEQYSQLQIEYYLDENRKVVKKNPSELKKLLENKVEKNNYSINTKKSILETKINLNNIVNKIK